MEKYIRGFYNLIRILIIKIKCGSKVDIKYIQPMRLRSQFMIQKSIKKVVIGKNFKLETDSKVRVINGGKLLVGDNCFVNCNSYITVLGTTVIGNNCMIGPGVMIFDHDHDYKVDGGIATGNTLVGEIYIGNNVWIGSNCCILRGAKIEDNSVIAAGSIVKGNIGANTLYYQEKKSIYKTIKRG